MQVELAYGKAGLKVELPPQTVVLRPRQTPGLSDETAAIQAALRHPSGSPPLADRVTHATTVCIVHTDLTRATPNRRLLPVILQELDKAGVPARNITLLNALGTHRPQTAAEMQELLGADILNRYTCLQHNSFDEEGLAYVGETPSGTPLWLNKPFLRADLKILTGFIEPHFFAGFSGGPKAILPGVAGLQSVLANHSSGHIADRNATWGVLAGNPLWEDMLAAAKMIPNIFLVNVTLNEEQQISGVYAGELVQAHRLGCETVRQSAMQAVDSPFDIVLSTNAGYPLDQNLYQTVKGMSAAASIVKPGGTIVMASACNDGIPDHGEYARILKEGGSVEGVSQLLAQPGFSCMDQWQVQVQMRIQQQAQVHLYSDGLSDTQIKAALLTPCRDIDDLMRDLLTKYGSEARVCALPQGPLTIAVVGG